MTIANGTGARYRRLSLWLDTCGEDLTPRPALDRDLDVDVAVVGAGYTGLWTAYYLAGADPSLRIAVVEREIAGFGASGRNGGWCSALFPTSRELLARRAGRPAALALQRAMVDTVDEVGRVAAAEGIDVGWAKGGTLTLATLPAQATRLRAGVEADRDWGLSESDSRWLSAAEVVERVAAAGVLGAAYTPHCARVHPGRLVRGLARAVERRGVRVYERTAAVCIRPGGAGRPAEVATSGGRLRAEVVIRATEAYTPGLPGHRRDLAPIYSLIVATAPLPPAAADALGWRGAETITDGRRLIIYTQHTADGRIAFGGRGAPYHAGSRVRPEFDRDERVFAALERTMRELFPAVREIPVTHRWGGPVAVPRDWFASVGLDLGGGIGWAGGYIGDGVGTSNLAGRTLADLVLGRDTALTRLPWVGHRSRRWEPEPLRWLGINAVRRLAAGLDAVEARAKRRRTRDRRVLGPGR
jgi:glycine/D-amino acid oxidase-like deaminating enzyme